MWTMIRTSPSKPKTKRAPAVAGAKPEVRIFVSYSHKDEVAQGKLETHLAQLKRDGVSTWFDGDLNAGDALDLNIARELRRAHIFVALFSPDYLASKYCWEVEYKRAMGRRARGTMRVVGLMVRPCDWHHTRAAHFKLLPKDGRPVSEWRPADKAYLDATNGIRDVVKAVRSELLAAGAPKAKGSVGALKQAKVVRSTSKPPLKPNPQSAKRAIAKRPPRLAK